MENPQRGSRIRGWRLWLLRLALLVAAPTLFLCLVEVALRVGGYGYPTTFFVASPDGRAYVANEQFRRRFAPPSMSPIMVPVQVPATKAPGTIRLFVLGESAAMGVPDPAFSFARILEVMLRERHPETRFEVIDAALLGIGSHGVLPIARDCAGLQPDLFIIYAGNNEIVGPYSPFTVARWVPDSVWAIRTMLWAKTLRVGQLIDGRLRSMDWMQGENYRDQDMAFFREHRIAPDDPRIEETAANFQANLADMCRAARGAGARVILSTVATNLRDCPPLGSLHRSDLSPADEARWQALFDKAVALEGQGRPDEAAAAYAEAAQVDDRYAELQFRWARCLLAAKRPQEARTHYVKARDSDALPFRTTSLLNDVTRRVAAGREAEGVRLADLETLLARPDETPDGIPGAEWFYEHVHLTFGGNYALASLLLPFVEQGLGEAGHAMATSVPVPTRQRCAERLAYTPWDESRMAGTILALVTKPPCPDQLDHEHTVAALRGDLAKHRAEAGRREAVEAAVHAYQAAMAAAPADLYLAMNFALLELDRGRPASAARQMERVLEVFPRWTQMRITAAVTRAQAGQHDQAVASLTELLRAKPDCTSARRGLASVLMTKGDLAGAVAQLAEAIRLEPSPDSYGMLGNALARSGKKDEAAETLRKGMARFPSDASLHVHLGRVLVGAGKMADAAAEFREAVRLNPSHADAQAELARMQALSGQAGEAVAHYRAALEANPQCALALGGLAWLLATHKDPALRNGEEAVRLAEAACRQGGGRGPTDFDILGVAYAEAGRFDEAAKAAAEAVRLAAAAGDTRAVEVFRARLELYKAGKPFHLP